MANQTTNVTSTEYQDEGILWQTRYRNAYTNQLSMFKRFADWYDLMYSVITQKNMSLWKSKIALPVLASKTWNLVAKFISMKPGFEVRVRGSGISSEDLGTSEDLEDKATKATLKLEYDYDNPKLDRPIREKLMACLTDATITGTGLAKVPWTMCKETRYERPINPDGTIDMSKEKVIESIEGYNDLIPVNIFNVFVAPASFDLYNAPWIIIKEHTTLDKLRSVNEAKGVEVYKNLSQLEGARTVGDPIAIYKKSRNKMTVQVDPFIVDKTIDWIELYECYDKSTNMIISYVNASGVATNSGFNWVEVRRVKNPYWHGKYPLVRFSVKQRPYDFWGEGVFEANHTMQMAVNDVFNHYMDNWNLSVDGMLMAQESAGINDYIVEPGGLITYRTEEPKQFKFPEPNPASLNIVLNELNSNIENNTISQYSTGVPDSETDKTRGTKGGIVALQQAADDIVSFFRSNLQQSVKQMGEMWLSNNKQFMIKPVDVMVPNRNQMKRIKVQPQDMQYDMELRVDEASMIPVSDDQLKAQYSAWVQQLLQLQQASIAQHQMFGTDPLIIKFNEIAEEESEKFGLRNIRAVLDKMPKTPGPAAQQQQAELHIKAAQVAAKAMPQQSQGQQQPQPTIQDKMIENMNYKDVPDDIRRQMETQAGFQPSATGTNTQDQLAAHKSHNDLLNTITKFAGQKQQADLQQQQIQQQTQQQEAPSATPASPAVPANQ